MPRPIASASATATTTSATASRTLFARAGFVHRQSPTFEILPMKHGDGLLSVLLCGHFDKAKPAGLAGSPILHYVH